MNYVTCAQASKFIPGNPPAGTISRWTTIGVGIRRNKSAPRIYLKCHRVGGKVFTTADWVTEFFEASAIANQIQPAPKAPPPQRKLTDKQRERRIEDAERELASTPGKHRNQHAIGPPPPRES